MSKKQDLEKQARQREEEVVDKNEQPQSSGTELPPRSEIHRNKEEKITKLKIKFPIVRILAFVFILMVILVPGYHYWKDAVQPTVPTNSTELDNNTVDIIEIKTGDDTSVRESQSPSELQDEFILPEEVSEEESSQTIQKEEMVEGEELSAPDEEPSTSAASNEAMTVSNEVEPKTNNESNTEQYVIHVVKHDETLYRISMKYFKSRAGEEIIKKTNNLNSDGTVYTGQRLKIPTPYK